MIEKRSLSGEIPPHKGVGKAAQKNEKKNAAELHLLRSPVLLLKSPNQVRSSPQTI